MCTPIRQPPLDVPMTAAGGLYTSAADLARFLRFELNGGSIDGRVVLDPKWLHEMQTVPPPRAGAPAGTRSAWSDTAGTAGPRRPDLFEHGGGGFGFLSDLWWPPQLGIGIAVLTNSEDHQLQNDLALSILADLVSEPGVYRDRLLALPSRPGADDPDALFVPPAGMASLVANAAMVATGDEATRWAAYSGPYRMPAWGYLDPSASPDRFVVDAGVPYFEAKDPETESLVRHRLAEVEPGLFLADNGETLDLRGQVPTWRNLRLVRVAGGPSALAVGDPRGSRARRRSRGWSPRWHGASGAPRGSRSSSSDQRTATRRWRRVTALVASATALLMLATVALLAWIPGLVDSGFAGGLDLSLGRAAGRAPAAGRSRPGRLDGGSRRFGLDRTLVVEGGDAAVRRPCCRGDRARPAPRRVASHRVEHELRLAKRQVARLAGGDPGLGLGCGRRARAAAAASPAGWSARAAGSNSWAIWSLRNARWTDALDAARQREVEDAERAQRRRDVDLGAPPAQAVDDRVRAVRRAERLHPPRRVHAPGGPAAGGSSASVA